MCFALIENCGVHLQSLQVQFESPLDLIRPSWWLPVPNKDPSGSNLLHCKYCLLIAHRKPTAHYGKQISHSVKRPTVSSSHSLKKKKSHFEAILTIFDMSSMDNCLRHGLSQQVVYCNYSWWHKSISGARSLEVKGEIGWLEGFKEKRTFF